MPKLWAETVATHRHEVSEAIQDAAVTLVNEQGLLSVTMSQIAQEAGIGRATLYKYFPDIETILRAWHERQIQDHLQQLEEASVSANDPFGRLAAVLHSYALIVHGARGHRDTELAALLHGHHESHSHAERQLRQILRKLLHAGATARTVRSDVSPDELSEYCLAGLSAANRLSSKAAVQRLVDVTLSGLRP
jgi:AcrR family transcriptional regulator